MTLAPTLPPENDAPMLLALSDFTRFGAEVDGTTYPVIEIFIGPDDRHCSYAAVECGGFLTPDPRLVPFSQIGNPDTETGRLPLRINAEALEPAPAWLRPADPGDASLAHAAAMAGPAGAGLVTAPARDEPQPKTEADRLLQGSKMFSRLCGTEIVGPDGPCGTVRDVLVDRETGQLTHLTISDRLMMPDRSVTVVPLAHIGPLNDEGRPIETVISEMEFECAPVLQEMPVSDNDQSWYDRLKHVFRKVA